MTRAEVVDEFLAATGRDRFTRADLATWAVEAGHLPPRRALALRRASQALLEYDRRQRSAHGGYQEQHVIRSHGYGPKAVWQVLEVTDAHAALYNDCRDAAGRLVRDMAGHAQAAVRDDAKARAVMDRTVDLVAKQLELMVLQVGAS